MPLGLLASREPSTARGPAASPPVVEGMPSSDDPTHPIFALPSSDCDPRKQTFFRRMFSSVSDAASPRKDGPENAPFVTKRSSLVPPNYTNIFKPRTFVLTNVTNKLQWAEELVAVPDNGVRFELVDMYAIFVEMDKRPLVLTYDDIDLFYDWFNIFHLIVEEMFYLEEACLYPWIEGTDELSDEDRKWEVPPNRIIGELSEAGRVKRKGNILTLGREIKDCRQEFIGRPVLQGLPTLAEHVEQYVDEIMAYLDLKKNILPQCIKSRVNQKDRRRFEKKYWLTARKMEMPAYTVIAATRWMDRRQVRRWKSRWFAGSGKAIYGKWKKTFEKKHLAIIAEFSRRVIESQLERNNQVAMHEMARARAVDIETPDDDTTEDEFSASTSMTRDGCANIPQHSLSAPCQIIATGAAPISTC